MHAPLRRFFERLSNCSNNGGASQPYIHNKRSHDNKRREDSSKRWQIGRDSANRSPDDTTRIGRQCREKKKQKPKTGIMLVSQACGHEPQKQENEKNVHTRKWACMSKEMFNKTRPLFFWLLPFLSLSLTFDNNLNNAFLPSWYSHNSYPGSNLLLWIECSQTRL